MGCLTSLNSQGKISFAYVDTSAARFGNLYPFGLLFELFGDRYFALATLKFGYFSKIVIKTCLKRFLA